MQHRVKPMASETSSATVDGYKTDKTGTGATASTYESAEGHGGGGLPQLEMQYWGGQIVWLLLIFAVLYVLLSRVFLPRFRAIQDQRAETISTAVATARSVQDEATEQAASARAEVIKARAESRSLAAAAKARVTEDANARSAAQEAEVNLKIETAEAAIARTRDAAMANVATIATETTAAIVEHLTGKPASSAELTATKGIA